MLEKAFALHRQGQFAEAERLYHQVLKQEPQNAQAWHLLGLMTMEGGWPAGALAPLERARALAPRNPAIQGDLGRSLHMLGRPKDAVYCFDRAIALAPEQAEAYSDRGLALQDMGELEAALASCDRAIALKPDLFDAHNNRGTILARLQRSEEALESFERAIALRPESVEAHNNRGSALIELSRAAEALENFDCALAAGPFAFAHANRGSALTHLGRLAEALTAFEQAVGLEPQNANFHYGRANTLMFLRQYNEALASYDRALTLQPHFADGHINRGMVLARLGRLEDAVAAFDQAIAFAPDMMGAHTNRGLALVEMGRSDEAQANYAQALARNPDYITQANFCNALILLLHGRMEEGWPLYEARTRQGQPIEIRTYSQPVWLGEAPLTGKTLYVYSEQGLGDTIMFGRYLALAKAQGATVIFSPQDELMRLFQSYDPVLSILPLKTAPAEFDYHLRLESMPLAFRTTIDTVPATIPYLHAEPDRIAQWRDKIGAQGLKIGVCWASSGSICLGMERSFSLRLLEPLAQIPEVRLISLQKGEAAEQLADMPSGMIVETLGADFDAGPDAFLDTAAVMQSLDLIISCDTSTAHLAGALGHPVWMALKHVPEWRWLLERTDSPWYPTMRLFRQHAPGDWPSVFADMRAQLVAEMVR